MSILNEYNKDGPMKILVVEDEAMTALYIKMMLEKKKYTVITVSTGEKAVEFCKNEMPELVFMDIHLAGEMDGIEASRKIRSYGQVPIVFTTGYQEDAYLKKAEEIKPLAYITKPIDINIIEKIITENFPVQNST